MHLNNLSMAQRLIGRTLLRWNQTPVSTSLRSISHHSERINNASGLKPICNQQRHQSDFLKQRAVEALKRKNARGNDDTSKIVASTAHEYGDDHQLAGLTAAAAANPTPSPATKIEAENVSAAPTSTNNTPTEATQIPKEEIHEVTNLISDPSPWAHMQLHEFAPKIVVVGVGGAGTNAVNNMVASGLSGESTLSIMLLQLEIGNLTLLLQTRFQELNS